MTTGDDTVTTQAYFIEDLADGLTGRAPKAPAPIAGDDDGPTTLAVGEEGDDDGPTTMAMGEEGDDEGPTTMAIGEEGDD